MSVAIDMRLEWKGNMRFVRDIIKRADPVEIQRAVLFPFRQWVLTQRIIWMYQAKGAVPNEQPRWAKLSEWTYAQKGPSKNLLMLSSKQFGSGAMARSYNIRISKSPNGFDLVLNNTARSTSKWSKGFDYPSALHDGWGPYTVKPRPDGPGYLRIPFMGSWRVVKSVSTKDVSKKQYGLMQSRGVQGDLVFHSGRAGSRKKNGRTVKDWDTFAMYRAETHPTGAPARPHIKFFRMDALELAQRTIDWCMDKKTHGMARAA